jgi:hypothetical protein
MNYSKKESVTILVSDNGLEAHIKSDLPSTNIEEVEMFLNELAEDGCI